MTKTSRTSPRAEAASTRLTPSARKRPARRRATCRCNLTAAATLAERSVSTAIVDELGSLSRIRGRVDVLGQRRPRDVDERGERRRIGDRDVGEVLAVHLDSRGLQALDQPVVGDVIGARGRLIQGLKAAGVEVDRKNLADIAI